MLRQPAANLLLLSSGQVKEWRDLFLLVLPFVGGGDGWLRKPRVLEDSLFPANRAVIIFRARRGGGREIQD